LSVYEEKREYSNEYGKKRYFPLKKEKEKRKRWLYNTEI